MIGVILSSGHLAVAAVTCNSLAGFYFTMTLTSMELLWSTQCHYKLS